jgi:hypothetical protein
MSLSKSWEFDLVGYTLPTLFAIRNFIASSDGFQRDLSLSDGR